MPDLTRWWPLPDRPGLRAELEAAWRSPERGYHDVQHLAEVLERLAELGQTHPFDREPVLLAAWFHDAVYDGERDAEERSAHWAATALSESGVDVAEVVRLVLVTEHHRPAHDDRNGAALSDADLAILASPPQRYADYTAGVRAEYGHLEDRDFALGRIAVLESLVGEEWIFTTQHARDAWEHAARANVSRELVSLRTLAWDDAGLPPATD